jgi:NIMA (never in mitosis gene a)-related kinase
MNKFQILNKLGEGAFGQVFKVKRISDGDIYAMKKVKVLALSAKEKDNALNEVRILASINHINLVGFKEAFFEESANNLCFVMEFCDGGDLLGKINSYKKKFTKMPEKEVWLYFVQMVRGLKCLHDKKIVHRDIKCANVFLSNEGTVKLGDLNVSKVAKSGLLQT